ncbi:MAG: hypothetical protein V8T12_06995 [Parabacteroides johnsonii]
MNKINKQQRLLDEKEQLLVKMQKEIRQNEAINANAKQEENKQIREKMLQAKKEILILKCEKLQHSSLFQESKSVRTTRKNMDKRFPSKIGTLKRADRLRLSELASSRTRYRNFEKDRDRNLLP